MKKITSLLVVLTLTVGCMAQSINFIPNVSSLKEKQDYVEYQELIVDTA